LTVIATEMLMGVLLVSQGLRCARGARE